MLRRLALLAVALVAIAGCKGDRKQCEKACRNFSALVYWDKADKEILAAPAEKQAELKKKALGKFEMYMEEGVDHCVNQCSSANNDKMIDCMIAAKTASQAKKCAPKED